VPQACPHLCLKVRSDRLAFREVVAGYHDIAAAHVRKRFQQVSWKPLRGSPELDADELFGLRIEIE